MADTSGATLDYAALQEAGRAEVAKGLHACQMAVARDGEVLWAESFGAADPATRFLVASATKPIVSSALWNFLAEGRLELERPVVDYVPGFGSNGKEAVSVEQVFLMTCGFPTAPMPPLEGADPERRRARMAEWSLEYEPGTRYAYHGGSAHWVLAELIEQLSGRDFRDFVAEEITAPLGLPRLLGLAPGEQEAIAQLKLPPPKGLPFDLREMIQAGVPGGGGVMTAGTLARFYQGLLHNPEKLWDPLWLADATGRIRTTLPDPLMKLPANRTLGVVIGAGFGTTWAESPTAYGWPGAGGQVGFAEPTTGISFAFLQAGDPEPMSQFGRAIRMSNLALALGR